MELNLILSSIIPAIVLIPIVYILYKKEGFSDNKLSILLFGGVAISVTSIIMLLPTYLLYSSSTIHNYRIAIENKKGLLVSLLILFALITEAFRFKAISMVDFFDKNITNAIIFGIGWGAIEVFIRFAFFFDSTYTNIQVISFYLIIIAMNTGLSVVYIRAAENTKFVIFGAFMKFIFEIAIYGGFGYTLTASIMLSTLSIIVLLELTMVYLSMYVMKLNSKNSEE